MDYNKLQRAVNDMRYFPDIHSGNSKDKINKINSAHHLKLHSNCKHKMIIKTY